MAGPIAWALATLLLTVTAPASAQSTRCDIPREARGVWRCENGFVIGPENVIIRLPIPETDPEALYNAGIEAAGREDWRVAIAYFTAAHQRAHLVPRYMYNLGLAHARAGNEVAAIAWLAAYLTAEPNAPNRAAIWAQIARIEASAQQRYELIRGQALAAAEVLPQHQPPSPPPPALPYNFLVRADGVSFIDSARASVSFLRDPRRFQPTFIENRRSFSGGLSLAAYSGEDQAVARVGGVEMASSAAAILRAARSGDREALQRAITQSDSAETVALAAQGRIQQAIEAWPYPDNSLVPDRESRLAVATEVVLLSGNLQNAESLAGAMRDAVGRAYNSGWESARIDALLLAETGRVGDAVQSLQIFLSRRHTTPWRHDSVEIGDDDWATALAPQPAWDQARFDSIGLICEYLVWRGRVQEALELAQGLDSMRASDFAIWLHERVDLGRTTFSAAAVDAFGSAVSARARGSDNVGFTPNSRAQVERLTWAAQLVSGGATNSAWWVGQSNNPPQRFAGNQQFRQNIVAEFRFKLIAIAAADMRIWLDIIHHEYQGSGRTWGS
ncbi:MAG: tetratricopeptide repeat protein [Hyphomonadaceae bacterium]|nr:tetratricopeptide repeat protein [Hyphomonadaceae bacterium]